jgi:hypothetical protein
MQPVVDCQDIFAWRAARRNRLERGKGFQPMISRFTGKMPVPRICGRTSLAVRIYQRAPIERLGVRP